MALTEYTGYHVQLEIFEGPLDLLLHLIKRDEIDIYDIPIVHITEQYLAYVRQLLGGEDRSDGVVEWWSNGKTTTGNTPMLQYSNTPTSHLLDLDSAGEFLVMASTLMQIKSRMLLPRPVTTEEEEAEDPRAELVEMLLEYRRFKEAATSLRDYAEERQLLFTRPQILDFRFPIVDFPDSGKSKIKNQKSKIEVELSLSDLLRAVENLMRRRQPLIGELRRETFSVAEKVAEIEAALLTDERIPFAVFFPESPSRLEIIVTFLALLEVVRKRRASVQQHRLFDVIYVCRPRPLPEPDPSEEHETTDHETTSYEVTHHASRIMPEEDPGT